MKKLTVFALVLVVMISSAAASVIQLGPTATYKNTVTELTSGNPVSYNDFGLGADVRINVPYVQLKVLGSIGTDFQKSFSAATAVGLNLRLVQGPIEFAIGPAVGIDFLYNKAEGWTFNGYEASDFANAFKASNLQYHASLGINIASFGLSLSAYVPTSGTFCSDFNAAPLWDQSKVSLSFLFNLL